MRGKYSFERDDAALLRLAAGDPVDRIEGGERPRRGVGVGRLGIVDEEHRSAPADDLHAMREAGKALHGGEDDAAVEAERLRRAPGDRRVLPVVQAAQRRQAGEGGFAPLALEERAFGVDEERRALVAADRDGDELRPALALQRRGDRLHRRLVDADDGGVVRRPC